MLSHFADMGDLIINPQLSASTTVVVIFFHGCSLTYSIKGTFLPLTPVQENIS